MRGAGASCSAAAWCVTSAGRHPLVSMPISTRGMPERRRLNVGLFRFPGAHALEHRGVVFTSDRPATVPQVEARPHAHRVLLRGGERRERADIAPVGALLVVLYAGHAVLGEIVGVH